MYALEVIPNLIDIFIILLVEAKESSMLILAFPRMIDLILPNSGSRMQSN